MSLSAVEVLEQAAGLGLKLGVKEPNTLTFEPVEDCPDGFVEVLKQHKPQLLALLRLPFVIVDSKAIGKVLFFCADEYIKTALLKAGASEWSIYTHSELRALIVQNRTAPISADELRKIHEIRRTFRGEIKPPS